MTEQQIQNKRIKEHDTLQKTNRLVDPENGSRNRYFQNLTLYEFLEFMEKTTSMSYYKFFEIDKVLKINYVC